MSAELTEHEGLNSQRLRLSSKITGIIFWGAVLTGLLVVAVFINQSESEIENQHEYQTIILLRAIENTLIDIDDKKTLPSLTEKLENTINTFKIDEKLVGAEIQVGLEKILIGTPHKKATTRSVESNHILNNFYKNKILLTAYFDSSSDINNVRKNLIVFLGVISFAFGLIINLILKKMLTNPIDKMIEIAAFYAKGDKSVRFNESIGDEFGFMSQFINMALDASETMQQQLEESVHEQREAKERAELALKELEQAKDRLVQSEKLASLGQLTAGIAHEIKNPLNFINNFSETSVELFDELNETITPHLAEIDEDIRDEIKDILENLSLDLSTISKHGKRADSIVKNMLMHSRNDGGEAVATDINALIQEALGLAYHGERASDRDFQIEMDTQLENGLNTIMVLPQDITRVLINLFSNTFYATKKRNLTTQYENYTPTIKISTKSINGGIEIRIHDNGVGIDKNDLKNIFSPFFTTKPTGQGTGLGLSISHDIIVKQNNGHFEVNSEKGEFTEFIIWLPENTNNNK